MFGDLKLKTFACETQLVRRLSYPFGRRWTEPVLVPSSGKEQWKITLSPIWSDDFPSGKSETGKNIFAGKITLVSRQEFPKKTNPLTFPWCSHSTTMKSPLNPIKQALNPIKSPLNHHQITIKSPLNPTKPPSSQENQSIDDFPAIFDDGDRWGQLLPAWSKTKPVFRMLIAWDQPDQPGWSDGKSNCCNNPWSSNEH